MKVRMTCTRGEYRCGQEYELNERQATSFIDYGIAVAVIPVRATKTTAPRKKSRARKSVFDTDTGGDRGE